MTPHPGPVLTLSFHAACHVVLDPGAEAEGGIQRREQDAQTPAAIAAGIIWGGRWE